MEHQPTNRMKVKQSASSQPYFSSPARSFLWVTFWGLVCLFVVASTVLEAQANASAALLIGVSTYLVFAAWAIFRLHQTYPHSRLGLCNMVTLARLVVAGLFVVAIVGAVDPSWFTFCLAALALSLDGVDGWLARKQRLTSEFGAWFDVEVDALFALLLSVFAATSGLAAAYVVILGLPYYLFWFAKRVLPWLDHPLPESFSRKAVCVFQIGALIALQVPLLEPGQLDPLVALVAIALIWSFGRDILWLRRVAHG